MPRGGKRYSKKSNNKGSSWKKVQKKNGTVLWQNKRLLIVKKGRVFVSFVRVGKKWIYLGEYDSWKGAKSVFFKKAMK